jgi:hypothetical protein
MDILYWRTPAVDPQKKPVTFYLGLTLYASSFFLPAVNLNGVHVPGWECAWMAFYGLWLREHVSILAVFGGLINPIAIAYAVLRIRDRASQVRKVLALAGVAFIPITWLSLSEMELGVMVGHVLWITGLFLIFFPARTLWPAIHDARWLAVPPLLVLVWWGLREATTSPLQPLTDRDLFVYQVALEFKEPGLCQKIPPYAEGKGSGDQPGYQISYLQSDCYFELASALHDTALCDNVRPVSKGMRDGSKYAPKWCRVGQRFNSVGIVDPHTISTWMQALGYSDSEIYQFNYRKGYNSYIHEAYDGLRKGSHFAEKVAAGPSFNEPRATASARPPNDLEYLYAMFAVDANDATLCGKVSPNARRPRFNQQMISLQVECYHDLAKNTRDPGLCRNVPASSYSPSGRDYDQSRETCLRDVEIVRRDPTSKAYWSPGLPPTFDSFKKALEDIGYKVDLPRLTYSDYEDFLQYLESHDSAVRAEFLRRVAALK